MDTSFRKGKRKRKTPLILCTNLHFLFCPIPTSTFSAMTLIANLIFGPNEPTSITPYFLLKEEKNNTTLVNVPCKSIPPSLSGIVISKI